MDLNKDFESIASKRAIKEIEIPQYIMDGLRVDFTLREWQVEAIKRFIYYYENRNDFQAKIPQTSLDYTNKNHLLFNMATGAGKTLIMVALMLYLKEQGYTDFIFCSHLNSINTKTEENFFNKSSNKYLFNAAKEHGLHIEIKSYQGLTSEITTTRENGFSIADIKDKKIVIIADESHHLNAGVDTNGGEWEDCINKVLNANSGNFLLEFTATINWNKLSNKYLSKCLIKYDLKDFYNSGYTKSIYLLQRQVEIENLMLGAIILNKYREVKFNVLKQNIKPVILFKSKAIAESIENHTKFNNLIANLTMEQLKTFYEKLDEGITKDASKFLLEQFNNLDEVLKIDFAPEKTINTNETKEVENNAKLLNTLESKTNLIRCIFSVNKLNEGWDVLNLFDIVKLYETQTASETTQEAQLLGRGARYCPFDYEDKERDKRKNIEEYEVLETLYFHSQQDNIAIGKLRKELEAQGITLTEPKKITIKLKDNYKEKLKTKLIFKNKKEPKPLKNNEIDFFATIKANCCDYIYTINDNKEVSVNLMSKQDMVDKDFTNLINEQLIQVGSFNANVKYNAIINNSDYNFADLKDRMGLKSLNDFIKGLDDCEVKVVNYNEDSVSQYAIYSRFLNDIYPTLSRELKEYVGTKTFTCENFMNIFKEKITKIKEYEEKQYNYDWYVYDKSDLTSEEISFMDFFKNKIHVELAKNFKNIYLIRNELDYKVYNFEDGVGFCPDFVLLMEKDNINYQILIEPKGDVLLKYDEWKENFLKALYDLDKKMQKEGIILKNNDALNEGINAIDMSKYKLIGMSFYNEKREQQNNLVKNEFENL